MVTSGDVARWLILITEHSKWQFSCQDLPLGALISLATLSCRVLALFKKLYVFNTPRMLFKSEKSKCVFWWYHTIKHKATVFLFSKRLTLHQLKWIVKKKLFLTNYNTLLFVVEPARFTFNISICICFHVYFRQSSVLCFCFGVYVYKKDHLIICLK